MLCDVVDVLEHIFHPAGVFTNNLKAHPNRLALPIFDVLSEVAHLTRNRRNPKSTHNIIISISAHLVSDDFVGVSGEHTLRKMPMLLNILKDRKIPWVSLINVIWLMSIVWPDELIPRSMTIYHKLNLPSIRSNKVPHRS